MDVREKLVELLNKANSACVGTDCFEGCKFYAENDCLYKLMADVMISHGVTAQECGEWVHPKGYVVSNGFLCSKCGHEQSSYRPINPRSGGVCIADKNGNFFYPPELKYCPNCGAKMMPQPPNWVRDFDDCHRCAYRYECECDEYVTYEKCNEGIVEWLKQPAE